MNLEFRREIECGETSLGAISICMKLDEIRKALFLRQRRKEDEA